MSKPRPRWLILLFVLAGALLGLMAAAGMVGPSSVMPWGRTPLGIILYLVIGTVCGAFTNWFVFVQ